MTVHHHNRIPSGLTITNQCPHIPEGACAMCIGRALDETFKVLLRVEPFLWFVAGDYEDGATEHAARSMAVAVAGAIYKLEGR